MTDINNNPAPKRPIANWMIVPIIFAGGIVGAIVFLMVKMGGTPQILGPQVSVFLQPCVSPSVSPTAEITDQKTLLLAQMGSSTEISDIEKDLRSTDLNSLDAEMGQMAQQLPQ